MDTQRARYVLEELDYLRKEWSQEIDDASLRRSCASLRSLLIENALGRTAHDLGVQLMIRAPAISAFLTPALLQKHWFYQAGGAVPHGEASAMGSWRYPDKDRISASEIAEIDRISALHGGKHIPVKLAAYLNQISVVFDGEVINRSEVIKYVANKLGGTHYDTEREANALGRKYAALDALREAEFSFGKEAVYYELLSIGQAVLNSRDIVQFRAKLVRELAKCT